MLSRSPWISLAMSHFSFLIKNTLSVCKIRQYNNILGNLEFGGKLRFYAELVFCFLTQKRIISFAANISDGSRHNKQP